jgi:hypothetical protein
MTKINPASESGRMTVAASIGIAINGIRSS